MKKVGRFTMGIITFLLLFAVCQVCFAGEDANILALSDWSKPVEAKYGQVLCARMMIAQEHSLVIPAHRRRQNFIWNFKMYRVAGAPMQIYFDPENGIHCEMLDANGKPPPPSGSRGSGGGPGPKLITLPHDSTIRLRANMYGYGLPKGQGLLLMLYPGKFWQIRPGNTNDYYLSARSRLLRPRTILRTNSENERAIWRVH